MRTALVNLTFFSLREDRKRSVIIVHSFGDSWRVVPAQPHPATPEVLCRVIKLHDIYWMVKILPNPMGMLRGHRVIFGSLLNDHSGGRLMFCRTAAL
ncbi:hypothetical protein Psi02_41460 [Planotetraspora silvatica]|uniref:Uncharacterized protein n=1 Tax=Planotetraspora silvatica TaxID=234614 RepID=A0A8J3XMR1_9ACTN|nr:hypothetical protein Psi02_41460 [Planotetraspora silvatica]